jgi:hypothetical protein
MVMSIIFHLQGTLVYQQIVQYNKNHFEYNRTYRVYKGIVSNMTIKQIQNYIFKFS